MDIDDRNLTNNEKTAPQLWEMINVCGIKQNILKKQFANTIEKLQNLKLNNHTFFDETLIFF